MRRQRESGQATIEYAITFAGIILPLTFMIIFTAQLLWVWHSVVDFTRDGARYATTHCWQAGKDNVQTDHAGLERQQGISPRAGGGASIPAPRNGGGGDRRR